MPLLIDCYNVLHAPKPSALAALDESGLCKMLARAYTDQGRITVVCDGVVKPLGLTESPVPEVRLLYSGSSQTADHLIISMIDADSAPRRLMVVSSDRQIQKAARRRRAKVLTSQQFLYELADRISRAGDDPDAGAIDHGQLPPSEVRRWLDEFGLQDHS